MAKVSFYMVAIALFALLYSPVGRATGVVANPGIPCMNENAAVTVTFNDVESDVSVIKEKFDEKVKGIEQASKEAGATKFYLQSSNYNVSQQNFNVSDRQYHLNGSMSFRVEPASKALGIMAILAKKGYSASVNVNSYNNGGFNCNPVTPPPVD